MSVIIGDYEYWRGSGIYADGAQVGVLDKTKTSYGPIQSSVVIDGVTRTVLNAASLFRDCENLVVAPEIPDTIQGMVQTFYGCKSLVTAPTIPSSVTSLYYCFGGCINLTGEIEINGNPTGDLCFNGTRKDIVLTGSSQVKEQLASTASNNNVFVWSLETEITASRRATSLTTVDIFVTVRRFRGNNENLTSLVLYKNGVQESVTWDDPTLTMTNATKTFTTTISNIAESDTPLLSIIATDEYGAATEVSVKIPVSFYTIDVQAGGKEIAFGTMADDDLTNYPNGLFKCAMDILHMNMVGEIKLFAGANIPNGWLLCDGRAVNRADYPLLFNAIGVTYGNGDGSTTFNLPNLVDRFPVGAGNLYALNTKDGSKDAVVVEHHHRVSAGWSSSTGTDRITYGQVSGGYYISGQGNVQFIQDTGVSGTDKNMPPFIGINFIICAA